VLEQREARPAVLVERAHLAVEHAVGASQRPGERARDVGEAAGEVVAVAAAKRRLAAVDRGDHAVAVPLDLVHPVVTGRRQIGRGHGEHRPQVGGVAAGLALVLADHEPVALVAVDPRRHERPQPVQALAAQAHGQAAVPLLLDQLVVAAIPDLDRPGAVLAGRDLALERGVVERVILDVHRQMPLALAQRDALGDGPALQGAAALDAEVEMQPAGVVPLDDEDRLAATALLARERLRRLGRVALAAVGVEAAVHEENAAALVLRPGSLIRSDGCKSSPGCVLGRADIPDIGAPCVLAMLDFRSPDHHGTSETEH